MSEDRTRGSGGRRRTRRGALTLGAATGLVLAATAAGLVLAAAPHRLGAQDRDDLVPVLPAGVPVVVLPVQSARPTPGGAWPGGTPTLEATLEALDAELAFAFGDRRGAEDWVMPREVMDRVRRNPIVRVDPARLSYHGLLRRPKAREQLYEPLHAQLRTLAALFGSRLVVLPLAVWYEPESAPRGESGDGTADASESPGARPPPRGRAVLLMALVDVRRAVVLWHGTMEGDVAEPSSPALLATLAQRVARQLSPS